MRGFLSFLPFPFYSWSGKSGPFSLPTLPPVFCPAYALTYVRVLPQAQGARVELRARRKSLAPDLTFLERLAVLFRPKPQPRLFLGRSDNGAVSLRLNDLEGRERLIIEVSPDGAGSVRFLDEKGAETGRLPASPDKK